MKRRLLTSFSSQTTSAPTEMIDGVKLIFYSETIVFDLDAVGIKVLTPIEELTGEIHYPKYANHQYLNFKISASNRVEITGSLHKYWKGENYSYFTFSELHCCIKDLSQKFKINPLEASVHNLEFGVNVSPTFNPYEFCDHAIALGSETFAPFNSKKLKIGFGCKKQQYNFKLYDKGLQYGLNENLLRIELRVMKMQFLKSKLINVGYLEDLLKPNILKSLAILLLETFSELIITDKVKDKNLTPS